MTISAPADSRTGTRVYAEYGRPFWMRLLLTREMAVIVALILVIVIASLEVRRFGTTTTLGFLLLDVAPILMIALPMTLVIMMGEIDLSVASTLGLSSVLLGILTQAGWPVPVAIVACLVMGLVAGLINGLLVTVVGLPSLAVTIGTLALYRGIAVGLLGTTAVTSFPAFWTGLAQSKFGSTGIPVAMVLVVALIVVFVALLHFTPFGRGIVAIGFSTETAHFSGVHVNRTKVVAFMLTGLIAALAGIYWTFRYGSARGDNAMGLELSVIAAVLLGGVSIFGGKGAIHGVIAGVLLIGVLQSALRLANVSSDVINIITGALLILSVLSPRFLSWFRSLRFRRATPEKQKQ
ncbi:ABC transporter permease [Cryobacterium sp. MDB1-18-2]|uniref:Autoinducer 2 import system permease protein LsrD n=1 Tax=Cryobacterium glucosi TaxID=1259175 RepID=A0ABY2INC3_9MICO|nr:MULTISPECIES: ABC transporter permease [Cryobacterium]MDY7529621.1 ABC transporter permease [Cryobacterium sp. 10C2]MEB0203674.1 ABC transporter permease [Cryobacterium sp. 5I3]MEB0292502.1 ABC transporter permease [Cryobacterium sp. 10C2]TFC18392.1 ABC transporter permease [Cryobacterium glucosi]TFC28271.1 ABC transporter permease [Cryobacterium sp. MDB1-18-2]